MQDCIRHQNKEMLDLRRPIYRATAAYGHFGRIDISLPWEATDKAELPCSQMHPQAQFPLRL